MFTISDACRKLLRKLYNRRYFGGKHTEEAGLLRSIRHLPRDEQKQALEDWNICKKEGLVIALMKTREPHVSLNPKKLRDIEEAINLNGAENE